MLLATLIEETERRFARRAEERPPVSSDPLTPALLRDNPIDRLARRLKRLGRAIISDGIPTGLAVPDGPPGREDALLLERVLGAETNLMNVAFLERGVEVARAVGRIVVRGPRGRWFGTGFMVSPRLLLTNNHVLSLPSDAATGYVEFNYQEDFFGRSRPPTAFVLLPDEFFQTDRNLDYTLVAVRPVSGGGPMLDEFGWLRLIEEEGKVVVREFVNIIQHPDGRPKQLALRENRITDILEQFLHYHTDTAPGSSGSPVLNDQWEVVGLHHSGVPKRDERGRILTRRGDVWSEELGEQAIDWVANEGVRISRILRHLRSQALPTNQRKLRNQMFEADTPPTRRPLTNVPLKPVELASDGAPVVVEDGLVVWTIPLQISVRIGQPVAGGLPAVVVPPEARPAAAESPELATALAELEQAAGRTYFDVDQDARDRDEYYAGLADTQDPKEMYRQLSRLLRQTHTRPRAYKPSTYVYPWVDLHPDRALYSIYSNRTFQPEELIRDDFRIEQERAARFRELLVRESALGSEAMGRELELLEANLPFNCEHVVPQSWFDKKEPMRGDLHHLFACEPACNSFRSNIPYFDFPDFEEVVRNDCGKREGNRFEPTNRKGTVARATLYFLLRYPGLINDRPDEYQAGRLETLLAWHLADPAGEYEHHRNQAIFDKQGNRNPLIDFPEWADRIDFTLGLG